MTDQFKQRMMDRLEGWELVEFLQIPTEDVIERFHDFIEEHEEDVAELVGLREED